MKKKKIKSAVLTGTPIKALLEQEELKSNETKSTTKKPKVTKKPAGLPGKTANNESASIKTSNKKRKCQWS